MDTDTKRLGRGLPASVVDRWAAAMAGPEWDDVQRAAHPGAPMPDHGCTDPDAGRCCYEHALCFQHGGWCDDTDCADCTDTAGPDMPWDGFCADAPAGDALTCADTGSQS
jgi:hypothetical protein